MTFEYKKFLTENRLTTTGILKNLSERDISGQYESLSKVIEDEMDDMVEQGEISPEERSKAQTELESDDDYLTYGSAEKAIQLLLKKVRNISEVEEEEPDMDAGPSAKEITKGSTVELAKKQNQLAKLLKRKDELVSKFKTNEISIDQYKQMIGNIPQHIKTLTADIEKLEGGELNEADDYENLTLKMSKFAEALDKYEEHQLKTMLVELAWKETTIEKLIDSVLEFENINN